MPTRFRHIGGHAALYPPYMAFFKHTCFCPEDGVCHSIDKYELVDSNRIIQTEIETFNVRLYDDPSVLIDMLKAAGFREIRMMKAFDKESSPDIGASVTVYECKK